MTYLQILNLIKDVALAQPNINSVVREFTDLNREDARYSAVVIQDRDGQRDRINEQDYITYTWHLGYVDRLTYDESNRDDIYSTGMVVINNIVAELRERFFPELEVTVPDRFTTFNQRFTASCAGVYVVLAVNMAISDCADYETDIYDKYQARFTENGHYHYVPDGRPIDEIDIDVEVPECKTEIERTVTINRNGQLVVTPPEGNVFSAVTVNTSIHPSSSLSATYTSNGTYSESGEWKNAEITVSVPEKVLRPAHIEFVVGEGPYEVYPGEGVDGFSEVEIEETMNYNPLSRTYTSNGEYSEEPVDFNYYSDAAITVDVHPSSSLSETYTSNGTYSISGEYNGGEVTVSVPQKTEIQRTVTINTNGQTVVTPPPGDVFSAVTVNTSIHPSSSLSRTYTSNGTYSETGEWKNAEITVSVPSKPEEHLIPETITENGEFHYTPPGYSYVYDFAEIEVDVHPSDTLIETITSNGTVNYSGEWTDATITVSVPQKTEIQRTVTINMNGQLVVTPPPGDVFSAVTVNTCVHPTVSLSETYTSNGTYSISGEYNGGEVTVAVSGAGKPEESLVQAITSNGSFHYDPTAGSVFSSADITVSVHPSSSLSVSYTSNGTYSISGEYNGGTVAVSVPTTSVLTVTQSQYDSILVKDSNTIYLING